MPSRLKKTREQAGLTCMALAQKAGASHATVGYLETNQRLPSIETIARLASALSVSAGWLGFGLGDMHIAGPAATCDDMGARLQAVRVEQERTKASLGKDTGLNPGTIGGIERGGQAGVATIEALAKALNVSPAWLAFNLGPQLLPKRRRAAKSSEPAHP